MCRLVAAKIAMIIPDYAVFRQRIVDTQDVVSRAPLKASHRHEPRYPLRDEVLARLGLRRAQMRFAKHLGQFIENVLF